MDGGRSLTAEWIEITNKNFSSPPGSGKLKKAYS